MIRELGLEGQMLWLRGKNAYFVDGKDYPMNTPAEILRFKPLSFTDRVKLGLLVFRIKIINDTISYDKSKAKGMNGSVKAGFEAANFFMKKRVIVRFAGLTNKTHILFSINVLCT